MKRAFAEADNAMAASCHSFSHSFATHLLDLSQEICAIQVLAYLAIINCHALNYALLEARNLADVV